MIENFQLLKIVSKICGKLGDVKRSCEIIEQLRQSNDIDQCWYFWLGDRRAWCRYSVRFTKWSWLNACLQWLPRLQTESEPLIMVVDTRPTKRRVHVSTSYKLLCQPYNPEGASADFLWIYGRKLSSPPSSLGGFIFIFKFSKMRKAIIQTNGK